MDSGGVMDMATQGSDGRRQRIRRQTVNPSTLRDGVVQVLDFIIHHSTFFRVHVVAFTFIPLIFSGIFYASNGRFHISFLDSLFLCYSAMTVTGLTTVNISTLTTWQQFILYFLMMIGDLTIVSWLMVLIRKRFFKTHCESVVAKQTTPKSRSVRSKASFMRSISGPTGAALQREKAPRQEKTSTIPNPSQSTNPHIRFAGPTPGTTLEGQRRPPISLDGTTTEESTQGPPGLVLSTGLMTASPKSSEEMVLSPEDMANSYLSPTSNITVIKSPRTGFALPPPPVSPRMAHYHEMIARSNSNGRPVPRRGATMISNHHDLDAFEQKKNRNFGGFPGPAELIDRLFRRAAPKTRRKLERTLTMDTFTTLHSTTTAWLNFDGLLVKRNSDFHTDSLTDEQLEAIGGAEYRALKLLSYFIPMYFVMCHLLSVLLFLPWLSITHAYDGVFENQFKLVSKPWFAFFQVMGAYTGGGISLVDAGMVPFQNAYLMLVALMFVILAGNHALPIFLRLIIWTASKFVRDNTDMQFALTFLLDHPRRCFLYLFPSHQTWFLVICLVGFSAIEWVGFLVLNIGLPAFESMPTGPRVIAGLFQGLAARASGFAIVPIASMAPALQFLYVVMMYIAVYPVAMSIRSTNVYEERSLGVFEAPPDDEDEEPEGLDKIKSSRERVGRYIDRHIRRQLSVDIWWLVWAVFIVAIIERKNIMDESKKWFDLFRILFELVSAFTGYLVYNSYIFHS